MKTCPLCREEQDDSQFEERHRVCSSCRRRQAQVRESKTPAAYLKRLVKQLRYHRVKANIEFTLTLDDCTKLWHEQKGRCALSGVIMTHHRDGSGHKEFNVSIDRINPDQPYTPSNVQLVAYRVNIMRHILPLDQFHWWVQNIWEHQNSGS